MPYAHCACRMDRVGRNCIYTLYMAVYLVTYLPKTLYIYIYIFLANPKNGDLGHEGDLRPG
jgi:hypothetical protein